MYGGVRRRGLAAPSYSIRVVLSRYIPTSHIGKEEISSSSFYLTRMAAELQGLVDKFKVKPER
jgi:hypothetical protein